MNRSWHISLFLLVVLVGLVVGDVSVFKRAADAALSQAATRSGILSTIVGKIVMFFIAWFFCDVRVRYIRNSCWKIHNTKLSVRLSRTDYRCLKVLFTDLITESDDDTVISNSTKISNEKINQSTKKFDSISGSDVHKKNLPAEYYDHVQF